MKRVSERQITKDDPEDSSEENASTANEQGREFERAPPEVMAKRKILKVRRSMGTNNSNSTPSVNPFAAVNNPTDNNGNSGNGNGASNPFAVLATSNNTANEKDDAKDDSQNKPPSNPFQALAKDTNDSKTENEEDKDAANNTKSPLKRGRVDDSAEDKKDEEKEKENENEAKKQKVEEEKETANNQNGKGVEDVKEGEENKEDQKKESDQKAEKENEAIAPKEDEADKKETPAPGKKEDEKKEPAEPEKDAQEGQKECDEGKEKDEGGEKKDASEKDDNSKDEKSDDKCGKENGVGEKKTSIFGIGNGSSVTFGGIGGSTPIMTFASAANSTTGNTGSFGIVKSATLNGASEPVIGASGGSAEKKENFKEEQVDSGEEGEEDLFRNRAKLYVLEGKGEGARWKERGVGQLKVKKNIDNGNGRLLMRTEATLRVVLNGALFESFKVDKATKRSVRVQVFDMSELKAGDKPNSKCFLIRFSTKDTVKLFEDAIADWKKSKFTEEEK